MGNCSTKSSDTDGASQILYGKNFQGIMKRSKSRQRSTGQNMAAPSPTIITTTTTTSTEMEEELVATGSGTCPVLMSSQKTLDPEIQSEVNSKSFYFINADKNNLQPDSSELLCSLLALKSISECRFSRHNRNRSSAVKLFRQTRLYRDQTLTRTRTNKPVANESRKKVKMLCREDVNNMRKSSTKLPNDVAMIIVPPFSHLDMIVPGIYQTGIAGIVLEDLLEARIKVIINATYEVPVVSHPGFISFRVPIEDDGTEPIMEYFDDVTDLMEATRLQGHSVVVHCMAGVSRSATLVLAYMIKYTTISLLEAFLHVKSIRTPIRPTIGFLQQLIQFEFRVQGRRSVEFEEVMVNVRDDGEYQIHDRKPSPATSKDSQRCRSSNSLIKVILPKFYRIHYPELYRMEIRRQVEQQTKQQQQQQEHARTGSANNQTNSNTNRNKSNTNTNSTNNVRKSKRNK